MRPLALFLSLVLTSISVPSFAQGGGRWNTTQNEPPPSEVIVARWKFGNNGFLRGFGWAHNYPGSDQNLNDYIAQATGVDIDTMSYRIVELGEDDVFDYPFAYISEPGEMQLTIDEVENFREFINRGGFVLFDDFDGPAQLDVMKRQVQRAFPGRRWTTLEIDHRLFSMHFELEDLHGMDPYVPGGTANYLAMFDDDGRVTMIAGHNNDLANFWDWYDEARMPLRPAADALRLGVNYLVYAISH